jgi:hypothetical protein
MTLTSTSSMSWRRGRANRPGAEVVTRVEENLAEIARDEIGYEHVVVEANVGYAPSSLHDRAEMNDIDLITIATHGRTGLERTLLGKCGGTCGATGSDTSLCREVLRQVASASLGRGEFVSDRPLTLYERISSPTPCDRSPYSRPNRLF